MSAVPSRIAPPVRVLLGPGPSDIPPSILSAMAAPTVGHLDPYFLKVMDESQSMLRQVFKTKNELTLAVSGTGSAGMETCVVNLIEPGDRMLVCVNGVFGGRMADVAGRAGAKVTTLERNFGEVFTVDAIATEVTTLIRAWVEIHEPDDEDVDPQDPQRLLILQLLEELEDRSEIPIVE